MYRIRRTDVDSTDEITKIINRLIDNQNQLEGKLLTIISAKKPEKKPKKKGVQYA